MIYNLNCLVSLIARLFNLWFIIYNNNYLLFSQFNCSFVQFMMWCDVKMVSSFKVKLFCGHSLLERQNFAVNFFLSSDNTKTFFTISQNLAHLTILKMNQPKKNSTKNHPKKLGILKASLNPPSWNMVTSKLLPVAHFVKGGWSYGYEL